MRIQPADLDDIASIVRHYAWLFEPPGSRPHTWDPVRAAQAIGRVILDDSSTLLVATNHSGDIIGFCTAYLDLDSVRYGQRCWVEDLAVDPTRRSSGIGGELLDAVAAWARQRGATHLELDTGLAREDAQRFYDRRVPSAKGYNYQYWL